MASIFANIRNLFKTDEELRMEDKKRRRTYERGIERSIEALQDAQIQARKDENKFYQEAKSKLAVGCETEARQLLQFSRMRSMNANNYTKQQLIWTNALAQLRVASSMQSAAQCFTQLACEAGLDPSILDNGLESIKDVEETIGEMNKAMSKKWEKDSMKAGEASDANAEGDASIDEMMNRARSEVAAENGIEIETGSSVPGRSV